MKLKRYGIHPKLVDWIESFLKGAGGVPWVRLWKMSLNTLLIEGVMVVI